MPAIPATELFPALTAARQPQLSSSTNAGGQDLPGGCVAGKQRYTQAGLKPGLSLHTCHTAVCPLNKDLSTHVLISLQYEV